MYNMKARVKRSTTCNESLEGFPRQGDPDAGSLALAVFPLQRPTNPLTSLGDLCEAEGLLRLERQSCDSLRFRTMSTL